MSEEKETLEDKAHNQLSQEILRCKKVLRKYVAAGCAHTADFAHIKTSVTRAEAELKKGELLGMTGALLDLLDLS